MARLTREERKAATRDALIRAGCDVVRARGFSVSVDDIASAAGFTKGAVYSNFDNRGELMAAIASRLVPGAQIHIRPEATTLVEAMEGIGRDLAAIVDKDPEQIILTLDLFVTLLRDRDLLATMWDLKEDHSEPVDFPLPLDREAFFIVGNALGIGMAASRLLFGKDRVPDELFAWAHRQLAAPPPGD